MRHQAIFLVFISNFLFRSLCLIGSTKQHANIRDFSQNKFINEFVAKVFVSFTAASLKRLVIYPRQFQEDILCELFQKTA